MTDHVVVSAPEAVRYDLKFTYFVSAEDVPAIANIQKQVAQAVEEYRTWQRSRIARDINPDKLTQLVKNAGAKRLVIQSPTYTSLATGQVAKENTVTITYGGVENE